jgi:hypothetical protein
VALRDELLFGRPDRLKVFVSSEMRSGLFDDERVAAAAAIEQTGFHFAWYWERDANAGPYSSEAVCLGHARTSDCLILLLATDLTPITRMEYQEAKEAGAACFLLVHSGTELSPEAADFLKREMPHLTYKKFGSATELQSVIVQSLLYHAVQTARRHQLQRRAVMSSSSGSVGTGGLT